MCDKCDCAHIHDNGACRTFERGGNGRCVYCDHDETCHPGEGPYANGPLEPMRIIPEGAILCSGCRGSGRIRGRSGMGVLVDHTKCGGRGWYYPST